MSLFKFKPTFRVVQVRAASCLDVRAVEGSVNSQYSRYRLTTSTMFSWSPAQIVRFAFVKKAAGVYGRKHWQHIQF